MPNDPVTQFDGIANVPPKTRKDAAFLVEHGWLYMTRSRYTYGWHYYWDHDKYRPRTGYWLTQGEAVRIQKAVNKRRTTPDGGRCA